MSVFYVLALQGVYYLISGLWPVVGIDSYMRFTGPKADVWLVKFIGLLIVANAFIFLNASWQKRYDKSVIQLSVLNMLVFAGVDFFYVFRGVIGRVYLLDAFIEILLLLLLLVALRKKKSNV